MSGNGNGGAPGGNGAGVHEEPAPPSVAPGEVSFWRQLDIVDPKRLEALAVTIIGAGGIGSTSALLLAKMGVTRLTVYDHDIVEAHNLPNQWYGIRDIGRSKVEALRDRVADLTGVVCTAQHERYEAQRLRGIVIVAVDNIDVRRAIWAQCRDRPGIPWFLEGRMGGEQFHLFTLRPCDPSQIARYEPELAFTHAEAEPLPCTATAIMFNTMGIAVDIASNVKRIAMLPVAPDFPPPFHIIRDFPSDTYVVGM